MKRFFPILIAAMLAGCHAVHAATITYGITNFNATAATNTLRITPISGPSFDGRFIVTGVPITTGTTNGFATNVLSAGNYLLELIRPSITNVAIRFAVPTGSDTYDVTNLYISGANVYNYTPGVRSLTVIQGGETNTTRGDVTLDLSDAGSGSVSNASALTLDKVVIGAGAGGLKVSPIDTNELYQLRGINYALTNAIYAISNFYATLQAATNAALTAALNATNALPYKSGTLTDNMVLLGGGAGLVRPSGVSTGQLAFVAGAPASQDIAMGDGSSYSFNLNGKSMTGTTFVSGWPATLNDSNVFWYMSQHVDRMLWFDNVRGMQALNSKGTTNESWEYLAETHPTTSTATLNAYCWTFNLDFSGMIVPGLSNLNRAALVTSRHAITADHAAMGTNHVDLIRCIGVDGLLYTNWVESFARLSNDFAVITFSNNWPAAVRPFKIFPTNFFRYLPGGFQSGGAYASQLQFARTPGMGGMWYSANSGRMNSGTYNAYDTTTTFMTMGGTAYEGPYIGSAAGSDSGSPCFTMVRNEVIFLGCTYSQPGPVFPFVSAPQNYSWLLGQIGTNTLSLVNMSRYQIFTPP